MFAEHPASPAALAAMATAAAAAALAGRPEAAVLAVVVAAPVHRHTDGNSASMPVGAMVCSVMHGSDKLCMYKYVMYGCVPPGGCVGRIIAGSAAVAESAAVNPVFTCWCLACCLQSLLCDPNPNSPANSEAARLYNENR